MIKILYIGVYPDWYKYSYGGEEHVQKIAEQVAKKGHEVHLVNSVYEGKRYNINFKKLNYKYIPLVNFIEKEPFSFYPKIEEMRKLIKEIKPDIIHHFGLYGYSTEVLKKKGEINVHTINTILNLRTRASGCSLYGFLIRCKPLQFFRSLRERYTAKNSDVLVAASSGMAEAIKEEYKISNEISIVHRGISLDKFEIQPWDKVEKNSLVFVGRLEKTKGVQYIIKAVSIAKKEIDNLKFYIIGDGYYKKKLQKLTEKLGVGKNVIFTGKSSQEQVAEYYGKANLFVMHSLFESFGVVALEAMASGRPVIATKTGGTIDIVTKEAGILVPYGGVEKLAKAITDILSNEGLAKKMAAEGRGRAEKFTWENTAEKYLSIYEKVMNKKENSMTHRSSMSMKMISQGNMFKY